MSAVEKNGSQGCGEDAGDGGGRDPSGMQAGGALECVERSSGGADSLFGVDARRIREKHSEVLYAGIHTQFSSS
jgi:hypothetical protein